MQQEALFTDFASALLFETPAEIYRRVFRELRPKTAAPPVEVQYCQFANVHSSIRLEGGRIEVRISDILEGAPAPVTEALAYILLGKMLRKPIARSYSHRYKLYLNRKDSSAADARESARRAGAKCFPSRRASSSISKRFSNA